MDYAKQIAPNIAGIKQALSDGDMDCVQDHMLVLHKALQNDSHLVDILQPADIGVMVDAEIRRSGEDLLAATTKPTKARLSKAKAGGKAVTTLAALDAIEADDF